METKMKAKLIVCVCILALFQFLPSTTAKETEQRRPRNRSVDPNYVYKRLRALEKKYDKSQKELAKVLERIDAAKGLFKDDPACPGVRGFFLAKAFNACYHIEPKEVFLNWTEAESTCQRLNIKSHLVSIDSKAENDFLKAKWKNERGIGSVSRFWTSGVMNEDGKWQWKHSAKDFEYTNWIPTTLHNNERYSCMSIHSSEAFFWGDVACWAPHMVTCKIQI